MKSSALLKIASCSRTKTASRIPKARRIRARRSDLDTNKVLYKYDNSTISFKITEQMVIYFIITLSCNRLVFVGNDSKSKEKLLARLRSTRWGIWAKSSVITSKLLLETSIVRSDFMELILSGKLVNLFLSIRSVSSREQCTISSGSFVNKFLDGGVS